LVPLLCGLVAAHGAFFGRRIVALADAEEAVAFARRTRSLQRLSLKVSWANLAVSATFAALAANA
jgi:hypothetical protein